MMILSSRIISCSDTMLNMDQRKRPIHGIEKREKSTCLVDRALKSMEEEAERLYKEERGLLLDDAASTRDAMHKQAELIERELVQMTEQIKSIINSLNASQGGGELAATDGMSPLDTVVRILNNQLSSLMWVDEKA